jgi:hypothetical protein
MLNTLEELKLEKEAYKLGEAIAKFMTGKNVVGIFSIPKDYKDEHFIRKVKSSFNYIQYDTCCLFNPSDSKFEDNQDITSYEGILMINILFNMPTNHIRFRKTSTVEYGINKFIPVLAITYEVNLPDGDKEIYDDRLRTGIIEYKMAHNLYKDINF